jgi:hypothetical protein
MSGYVGNPSFFAGVLEVLSTGPGMEITGQLDALAVEGEDQRRILINHVATAAISRMTVEITRRDESVICEGSFTPDREEPIGSPGVR